MREMDAVSSEAARAWAGLFHVQDVRVLTSMSAASRSGLLLALGVEQGVASVEVRSVSGVWRPPHTSEVGVRRR